MSYQDPPLRVRAVTPALVVGAVSVAFLAAPGAGKAYRVVGVTYMLTRTAVGNVEFNLQDSSLVAELRAGLSYNSAPAFSPFIPEPGIIYAVNSALTLQAVSTSATGVAEAFVLYYIENVS